MANTNVYTGADGSITLAGPQGEEGKKAQESIDEYQLTPVGRASNVRVEVSTDIRPFHELGQRFASELRSGNVNVRGTMGRAYINGALLKLMLGDAGTAGTELSASLIQPSFNITLVLDNPALPGTKNTLTILDAKFETWVYSIPEDDFVLESVRFKARLVNVLDEEASGA
ncbi:MAG: hypothetical protein GY765_10795 [bacterium]|nr:hypothetical protein [bacterium]